MHKPNTLVRQTIVRVWIVASLAALTSMGCTPAKNQADPVVCASNDETRCNLPEEYRPIADEYGNTIELKGYEDSEVTKGKAYITLEELRENKDEKVFSYEAPPNTEPEFSQPIMVTAASLTEVAGYDLTEPCRDAQYTPNIPYFHEIPEQHGCFTICIRLTNTETKHTTVVRTPLIIIDDRPPE